MPSLVDRKAKRVDVAMISRIRYRGMLSVDVLIRDLAFTGFRADCDVALQPGEHVSIDLPAFGLVPAKVAWCKDGEVGGLFESVVDIRYCVLKPGESSFFTSTRRRVTL